jgi:hypothetical protein
LAIFRWLNIPPITAKPNKRAKVCVLNVIVDADDVFVSIGVSELFFMPPTDGSNRLAVEHIVVSEAPIDPSNPDPLPFERNSRSWAHRSEAGKWRFNPGMEL